MVKAEATGASQISLIVFARRPRAGVKRRLARAIGVDYAARVYAALLENTLSQAERVAFRQRILMPATRTDMAWFAARYRRRGWRVRGQSYGNLGQRMAHALAAELGHGRATILVGSDIADISSGDLRHAACLLSSGTRAVLGPASDGGFWLIGMRHPLTDPFTDVPWSSDTVLARTLNNFESSGIPVALLPLRHDVDRARDLRFWRARAVQRRRACSRSSRAT